MRPIQMMIDDELLQALDASPEVQELGRSAVLRRAAVEYLERQRSREIRDQYRRAYAGAEGPGEELAGWEDEGVWPSE